jgi:hypothetical protein
MEIFVNTLPRQNVLEKNLLGGYRNTAAFLEGTL